MNLEQLKEEAKNLTQWEKQELINSIVKDMAICERISEEEFSIASFVANHDVDDILDEIGTWKIGNYIQRNL